MKLKRQTTKSSPDFQPPPPPANSSFSTLLLRIWESSTTRFPTTSMLYGKIEKKTSSSVKSNFWPYLTVKESDITHTHYIYISWETSTCHNKSNHINKSKSTSLKNFSQATWRRGALDPYTKEHVIHINMKQIGKSTQALHCEVALPTDKYFGK